jgi:hypothetical protein
MAGARGVEEPFCMNRSAREGYRNRGVYVGLTVREIPAQITHQCKRCSEVEVTRECQALETECVEDVGNLRH